MSVTNDSDSTDYNYSEDLDRSGTSTSSDVVTSSSQSDEQNFVEHSDSSQSLDKVMLTTIDNPFNPFTNFDEWFAFDYDLGYHTNSLLARVMVSSDTLSDSEQEELYEKAIDEIVKENLSGVHKKVFRDETKQAMSTT